MLPAAEGIAQKARKGHVSIATVPKRSTSSPQNEPLRSLPGESRHAQCLANFLGRIRRGPENGAINPLHLPQAHKLPEESFVLMSTQQEELRVPENHR